MLRKIIFSAAALLLTIISSGSFASVNVPGWPSDRIAMGTAVNGGQVLQLEKRPVDAMFTYAGENGAGDRGAFIPVDSKVVNIMQQAQQLEQSTGKIVRSVFVFYTVDGSDGVWSIQQDLNIDPTANQNNLTYHYANLIRICQLLESYKTAGNPVPATIILNPDFLGEIHIQCGQYYCPIPFNQQVAVRDHLREAVNLLMNAHYLNWPPRIPSQFLQANTTLADYIASVNWIMKTFAPDIPFGWQDNVWAGDSSGHLWIHKAARQPLMIASHVASEVAFLQQMQAFASQYQPNFIVFDKWERDVFDSSLGNAGVNNGYLYNSNDWDVYMKYVTGVDKGVNNLPIMLWQIPGGHLQINGDIDTRGDHASTAPDYFLGDTHLSNQLNNVQSYISSYKFAKPENYSTSSPSVVAYLRCPAMNQTCWAQNRLQAIAKQNVFAILWGGGSTTGIVGISPNLDDSGWLYSHLPNW